MRSDLTLKSICNLGNNQIAWGGSAAVHANGLLYIAKTISPINRITTNAYIAIYAVDSNTAGVRGTCACKVVATYEDTADNYVSITALYDPTVIARDSQGNLYAGKSSYNSYRMLYIPNSAPVDKPFQGMVIHNITNSNWNKNNFQIFRRLVLPIVMQ
jgi:hypothetical protein